MIDSNDLSRHVKAALASMQVHTELVGIDTNDGHGNEDSIHIAMYHLLHSLMDVSEREGFSFSELVGQVEADRDI